MSDPITLKHLVATVAGIFTAVMSYVALKDHSTFRNPVIPILVGVISAFGVYRLSEGWTNVILLPYAVLPFAFLVLFIIMALQGRKNRKGPFFNPQQHDVTQPPNDLHKTDDQP